MIILIQIHIESKISGGDTVKLDRKKFELAKARACMSSKDLESAGIPKGTICRILGNAEARPETIGKIAKALGVDVTEIIEQ